MRSGDEFRSTIRRGTKGAQPTLVTHLVPGSSGVPTVGFVVSRSIGSAVERNRVKRRLRHLMRERMELLPAGSRLVVRALPASSLASHGTLSAELDHALRTSGVQ